MHENIDKVYNGCVVDMLILFLREINHYRADKSIRSDLGNDHHETPHLHIEMVSSLLCYPFWGFEKGMQIVCVYIFAYPIR